MALFTLADAMVFWSTAMAVFEKSLKLKWFHGFGKFSLNFKSKFQGHLVGGFNSTLLKNISQIGSFPQVGLKIKNVWNHHLAIHEIASLTPPCVVWLLPAWVAKLGWFFLKPCYNNNMSCLPSWGLVGSFVVTNFREKDLSTTKNKANLKQQPPWNIMMLLFWHLAWGNKLTFPFFPPWPLIEVFPQSY